VDAGELDEAAVQRISDRFDERYGHLYGEGALLRGGGLEFEAHRVVGTRSLERIAFPEHDEGDADASSAIKGEREAYFEPDGFRPTPIYDGHRLVAGNVLRGPAIVERMGDAVVVPPDYEAVVDRYLTMRLQPTGAPAGAAAGTSALEALR
jgi:N-methylhydantoinase A